MTEKSYIESYQDNVRALEGLYDPTMERDACGVGLVAALDGKRRRDVVLAGIAALKALWHRGAVDADGKTGDGAGIHVEIPQDFFAEAIHSAGDDHIEGRIAVGMIFLPKTDLASQEEGRAIIESEILDFGYGIYGWRQVPIDTACIGEKANATRPEIEQIMVRNRLNRSEAEFERDLYVIRRRIEKAAEKAHVDLYVCSLSCRSLIYKGMFLAENLTDFYPDLLDERFVSRFAIYHQRYSTNTFPTWKLAQPFRRLAHNGEINTLSGNVNWMRSHETRLANAELDPYMNDLKPVVQAAGSDTAMFDNVFELLTHAGRDAPMAKTLMVPASAGGSASMTDKHRALFSYCNAVMEPWDGPAAICATDGRWIVAGLDRAGLRPLRYTITQDDLLIVGSEAGMVRVKDDNTRMKGRLGPGETLGLDLQEAKLYAPQELLDLLAERQDFTSWTKNIRNISSVVRGDVAEPVLFTPDQLRRRQLAMSLTHEELETILHPMVETSAEAIVDG